MYPAKIRAGRGIGSEAVGLRNVCDTVTIHGKSSLGIESACLTEHDQHDVEDVKAAFEVEQQERLERACPLPASCKFALTLNDVSVVLRACRMY